MSDFTFIVTVTTDTYDHAAMIMNERIFFDERYFVTPNDEPISRDDASSDDIELDYSIDWTDVTQAPEPALPQGLTKGYSDTGEYDD